MCIFFVALKFTSASLNLRAIINFKGNKKKIQANNEKMFNTFFHIVGFLFVSNLECYDILFACD